jgi:hypothetical protein
MSKNKGGREIRKPKQVKKPAATTASIPMALKLDTAAKKAK